MRRNLIVLALLFAGFTGIAQTTVDVVTGPSYADEVYYSLTEGSLVTAPRAEWDLALATNRFDVNILANHASGVEVYTYPDGDISAWATLDASNMANWAPMNNSIVNMSEGAFVRNVDPNDPFDFGWGKYNPASHMVSGDSLYVVKTVSGSVKKMWIVEKNPNVGINKWQLKYANLDGSDEQTIFIEGEAYASKNFMYFNLDSNELMDREPASNDWELEFTKFYDYTIPYNVTGVTVNSARVVGYQVDYVDQSTFVDYDETLFNDSLTVIGSNWKSFNGAGYSVDEDRVYFLKVFDGETSDSSYWKLHFTGFGGSSTGSYTFVQQQLGTASVRGIADLGLFELYPNPASDFIYVLTDTNEKINIRVIDMTGRMIMNNELSSNGFNKTKLDISQLEKGTYGIVVETSNGSETKMFVKK